MVVYKTKEWKGFGKQNYYWHEYRKEGAKIAKYKCHRRKFFDGKENNWDTDEEFVESWEKNDWNVPGWLKKFF